MSTLVDHLGRALSLGKKLGTGGEGVVFEIVGSPRYVAKLYHQTPDAKHQEKLSAMTKVAESELLKFAAWPRATLRERVGAPITGIVMPRISQACEIHELYSPAQRMVGHPRADWRFLIRTARNCAVALAILHKHHIVVGDVNQGNVLVSSDATVKLIDCDSFQIVANKKCYRCRVGVPHYTPPELQSARLSEVTREPNHDNFGLAVLIFHLLFMGRHPFAGRYSGSGDMPIEKAIKEFRFAYGTSASAYQMTPPPNCLELRETGVVLSALFERAFSGNQANSLRPTAAEWVSALDRVQSSIRVCADDSGHFYLRDHGACPWCRIETRGGPNFFLSVSVSANRQQINSFDAELIWTKIMQVPEPTSQFVCVARRDTSSIVPKPYIESEEDPYGIVRLVSPWIASAAYIAPLVTGSITALEVFGVLTGIVFTILAVFLRVKRPKYAELDRRKAAHARAETRVERLHRQISSYRSTAKRDFVLHRNCLQGLKVEYTRIPLRRAKDLQELQKAARQKQLDRYLVTCSISKHRIRGIGPAHMSTLVFYGIKTAFDVEWKRVVALPGFDRDLASVICTWRRTMESRFKFNPSHGVSREEIQRLDWKYDLRKWSLQKQLLRGHRELSARMQSAVKEFRRLDRRAAELEFKVAKRRADMLVVE